MRGYTVEMSFLMPVVLLLLMSSIFGVFYFHDKNILMGAAYETLAVGGTKVREEVEAEELEELFCERVRGKCILLTNIKAKVTVNDEVIEISGSGSGRGWTVGMSKSSCVTDPEKKIRDIRRIKGLKDGAKDIN